MSETTLSDMPLPELVRHLALAVSGGHDDTARVFSRLIFERLHGGGHVSLAGVMANEDLAARITQAMLALLAAEREACARLCETVRGRGPAPPAGALECARAIRARGDP